MIAGLLLAVGCALAGSVGVLLKQRRAVAAPTVLARHPLRSANALADKCASSVATLASRPWR
jgi:hypothetical protein